MATSSQPMNLQNTGAMTAPLTQWNLRIQEAEAMVLSPRSYFSWDAYDAADYTSELTMTAMTTIPASEDTMPLFSMAGGQHSEEEMGMPQIWSPEAMATLFWTSQCQHDDDDSDGAPDVPPPPPPLPPPLEDGHVYQFPLERYEYWGVTPPLPLRLMLPRPPLPTRLLQVPRRQPASLRSPEQPVPGAPFRKEILIRITLSSE